MNLYDAAVKPLLFRLQAEQAHELGVLSMGLLDVALPVARAMRRSMNADRPSLRMHVNGLDFPNPVGLGAGMDKDAVAVAGGFALGFGHLEVGTVTPRAQPGNPRPRAFRIPEHQALINRMGFNNQGMEAMALRLSRVGYRPGIIGVNIGKNRDTPLERAVEDYVATARRLSPLADYIAVNLSSPNTPGLRALQEREPMEALLRAVRAEVKGRPLWLKIAPDLADEAVDEVVEVAVACGVDALVCTNTTVERPFAHPLASEAGGLSGIPLKARSTAVVRRAFRAARGRLAIVGVGGIFTGADAWEKICAGASQVQLYTGFVYRGPMAVKWVLDELEDELTRAGLDSLERAVGRDA